MGGRVMSDDTLYRVVATQDRYAYQTYVLGDALVEAAIKAVCDNVALACEMDSWHIEHTFPVLKGEVVHGVRYTRPDWQWSESVIVSEVRLALDPEHIEVRYMDKEDR